MTSVVKEKLGFPVILQVVVESFQRQFIRMTKSVPIRANCYFLGDNVNAIEIQIWTAMIANLLLMLVRSKVKRQWAFSNMTSLLRGQLMSYINLYSFLNDPEKTWREKNETYKREIQLSIFPI